jgi:YHS domain-containing protein
MQVEMGHAPASIDHGGQRVFFCSDRCAERFAQQSVPTGEPAPDHAH